MNHFRVEQLISAYLDGEVSPGESSAISEHLLDCETCRDRYDRLRATKGLLGDLPVAEPPAGFWAVVHAPAAVREPGRIIGRLPVPRLPVPSWFSVRRPAWAIAAALVVLALAALPSLKGTVDRLHATEIGVDLYVREHALQMGTQPLSDPAYAGLVAGDADLVLAGETPRAGSGR